MESVAFHLKYWLKLTYLVVASTCMIPKLSQQRCRMTSRLKIECGNFTVNFSDAGTAHCSCTVSLR